MPQWQPSCWLVTLTLTGRLLTQQSHPVLQQQLAAVADAGTLSKLWA
jgi:hypothetical protein